MILLLAKSDPDEKGHQPVWGLQNGNSQEIKDKVLKILNDAIQNNDEDTLVGWCELAETIASQEDPNSDWAASHVYFFVIPDDAKYKIVRAPNGDEVAIYFQGEATLENIRFAEEIQFNDIPKYL